MSLAAQSDSYPLPAAQSEIAWVAAATGLKRLFSMSIFVVSYILTPLLKLREINDVVHIYVIINRR